MGVLKDPGLVCNMKLGAAQVTQFKTYIKNNFKYRLYLDELPNAVMVWDDDAGELVDDYNQGVPIGKWDEET